MAGRSQGPAAGLCPVDKWSIASETCPDICSQPDTGKHSPCVQGAFPSVAANCDAVASTNMFVLRTISVSCFGVLKHTHL